MNHPLRALVPVVLLTSALVSACDTGETTASSVDPATISDAPPPDARLPTDAPPRDVVDGAVDVAVDASVDAAVDVTVDASVDVAVDASVDVAVDASVDVAVDVAVDATVDATAATPLLLGLTVHLENHSPYDSAYAAALQTFAETFAAAGAVLTLEPRDEVFTGTGVAGPTLTTLETVGHGVGSHAATGTESGLTQDRFERTLWQRRTSLQTFARRVDHVSGICSSLDFITAAANAGFTFTTGATAQCILAMTDRPAGYEDLTCASATDTRCHAAYPTALTDRIHPWRALDGAHWLTDNAAGRLVVIPSSGSVPCLEEEATTTGRILSCRLDDADVTRALADLDAAIAAVDASRVNTYYWVWGSWDWSSTAVDPTALTRLLTEVGRRVSAGQVRWATAGAMYDAYTAWEATHR